VSRKNDVYRVGDYWLEKRRDGKSPEIWQIATSTRRTVVYRSTKCRDELAAREVLRSYEASQRSKTPQTADHAELIPHLFHYLREHGPDVHRIDTIKSSFRAWIGFFMQDELTTGVLVGDLTKNVIVRFRRWRMGPHRWEVEWGDKVYRHQHTGVTGEAVQRNIEDLRAALNHAAGERRILEVPKIASVDTKLRSKPRRLRLTPAQLGAMIAYADQEPEVQAWLWLMIGTGVRPDAALAFDPERQWNGKVADMHPPSWPITNKRNPVVPVIDPLRKLLANWPKVPPVRSRKRWWRTMRDKLALPPGTVAKTIRHTVATHLRSSGVPGEQISALLGHKDADDTLEDVTRHYAHVEHDKMMATTAALTELWSQVERHAHQWRADHLLTITPDRNKIITPK
jgi:integrase